MKNWTYPLVGAVAVVYAAVFAFSYTTGGGCAMFGGSCAMTACSDKAAYATVADKRMSCAEKASVMKASKKSCDKPCSFSSEKVMLVADSADAAVVPAVAAPKAGCSMSAKSCMTAEAKTCAKNKQCCKAKMVAAADKKAAGCCMSKAAKTTVANKGCSKPCGAKADKTLVADKKMAGCSKPCVKADKTMVAEGEGRGGNGCAPAADEKVLIADTEVEASEGTDEPTVIGAIDAEAGELTAQLN